MRNASRAKGIGVDERPSSISSVLDESREGRLTQAESVGGGGGGGGGGKKIRELWVEGNEGANSGKGEVVVVVE